MTSPEADPSAYEHINSLKSLQSQEYEYKGKQKTIATHIDELSAPTNVEENQRSQCQSQSNDQQAQQQIQPQESQQAVQVQSPLQEAQQTESTIISGDIGKRKTRSSSPECTPYQPLLQEETTWPFEAADSFEPSKPLPIRCRRGASWSLERGSKRNMFASSENWINPRLHTVHNPINDDTASHLRSIQYPVQISENNQMCPPTGLCQSAAELTPQSLPNTSVSTQSSSINPMQGKADSRWKRLKKFFRP